MLRRCVPALLAVLVLAGTGSGVELQNWRQPLLLLADDVGEAWSSPSGMFWDALRLREQAGQPLLAGLMPRTPDGVKGYWRIEPFVAGRVSTDAYVDGRSVAGLGGLASDIRFHNLLVRNTLSVDSRYASDPAYVWKTDRVAAGRLEEAYLQIDHRLGMVRIGRLSRNWGPMPDRSLLLSSNPFTYDGLEWSVAGRFFEFRHLFAAFDRAHSGFDTDSGATDRYLTAHSLNLMLGSWVTLGVSEAVLFARDGLPDLQYVNPVSIYTVTNTNGEGSGNLLVGLQWRAYPFTRRVLLRGQVVFDDVQVDNEDAGDQEPAHWGIDCRADWYDPLPLPLRHSLNLQYTYCSRWLYLVSRPNTAEGERYTYLDRSLGYPANDGDRWSLATSVIGRRFWAGRLGAAYGRAGGNSVTSPWQTGDSANPSAGYNGYRHETSLRSDSVQHTIEAFVQGQFWFADWVNASLDFTSRWVKNKGNEVSSSFAWEPVLAAGLSLHYGGACVKFRKKRSRDR